MIEDESAESGDPVAPRRAAPGTIKTALKWYSRVSDILTPKRIGLLLGAGLLALVGIVGGWSAAEEAATDLATLEVGVPVQVKPFELTVNNAKYFDELKPAFYAEEGYRYVVVTAEVSGTAQDFVPGAILAAAATIDVEGLRTIALDDGPKVMAPQVMRLADSLAHRTVQPGLATGVVLVWQQAISEEVPDDVTLTLATHTWRRSSLDGAMGWRDPELAARIVLPLEPLGEG